MNPLSISIVAIIFFSILFIWITKKNLKTRNSNKNLPSSPPSIPIIGNIHQLGSLPHRSLETLSRRHSRNLMLLHIGSAPVVVVSSATAAREVMKTHDLVFANRPKALAFEKLVYNYGDIATAPYGEYWRQIKSVAVLHLLSNKRVHSFRQEREEETKLMVDKIEKTCDNDSPSNLPVNLSVLFAGLTYDIICRVALGRKYDDDGEIGRKFKKMVRELTELTAGFNVGDYIPSLSWWSRVNGLEARMDRVAKEIDEFLEGIIEEREQQKHENYDDNFVDILLRIQRENSLGFRVDRTCIKAILVDVFVAGTDTTFTVLESAMVQLLLHPNSMKKLQNEVRKIVGKNTKITEDDTKKMPYLSAVLKETLRLHPPVPLLLPRLSTQDVKIMGYDVVSGSQVYINAWAIGRDPSTWAAPEEFRPERFLDSKVDYNGHDFELIPFGAGRRGCPGIQFAMTSIEIALANVVHKFDWFLPDSRLDMTEINGVTVHRKCPLMAFPQHAR